MYRYSSAAATKGNMYGEKFSVVFAEPGLLLETLCFCCCLHPCQWPPAGHIQQAQHALACRSANNSTNSCSCMLTLQTHLGFLTCILHLLSQFLQLCRVHLWNVFLCISCCSIASLLRLAKNLVNLVLCSLFGLLGCSCWLIGWLLICYLGCCICTCWLLGCSRFLSWLTCDVLLGCFSLHCLCSLCLFLSLCLCSGHA